MREHKIRWTLGIFSLLFFLSILGLASSAFCQCSDKNREIVKTGSDPDAAKINQTPVTIGIDEMNTWHGGQPYSWAELKPKQKTRIKPQELQVYHVEGMLTWYKCECDPKRGDLGYHLVLESEAGKSIVATIPNPKCVGASSPFLAQIQAAWDKMTSEYSPKEQKAKAMMKVVVEGPAFFEKAHSQLGRAENSVEIQPVLKLEFLK